MSPFLIKSCFRCPLCSLFVSQRAMWHTSSLTHFSSECVSLADSSHWCWSECTDLIGWVAASHQMHCWVGGRRWEVILQAVSSGDHEYLCTSLIHPIVINQSGSGPNPAGYHPLVCVLPFCILNLDKMMSWVGWALPHLKPDWIRLRTRGHTVQQLVNNKVAALLKLEIETVKSVGNCLMR